jgi:hypothetical protein
MILLVLSKTTLAQVQVSQGQAGNVVLALLTGALVLVTAYYAWQTHRMVRVMEATRSVQVLPRLHPVLRLVGPNTGLLRITNAGPGPALNVQVQLALEPEGPVRRWANPLIAQGESHDFDPLPDRPGPQLVTLDDLTATYHTLRLCGHFFDALGNRHEVNEPVDVREFWELTKAAVELRPEEWDRATAQHLETIAKEVKKWTRGISGLEVYTIDKERHDRKTAANSAFAAAFRELKGQDDEHIRGRLKELLSGRGIDAEPPDKWVRAIAEERDIWISVDDLSAEPGPSAGLSASPPAG